MSALVNHRSTRIVAVTVIGLLAAAASLIHASPASASTSCSSRTVTAYGYNDSLDNKYVRHTMTVAVCVNTSTGKLSSASCTVERAALKTNISMISGGYYKDTTGGYGSTSFICDSYQEWKWNRSVFADECAGPTVQMVYLVGYGWRNAPQHSNFTVSKCDQYGV
jgi:hypothetical protein